MTVVKMQWHRLCLIGFSFFYIQAAYGGSTILCEGTLPHDPESKLSFKLHHSFLQPMKASGTISDKIAFKDQKISEKKTLNWAEFLNDKEAPAILDMISVASEETSKIEIYSIPGKSLRMGQLPGGLVIFRGHHNEVLAGTAFLGILPFPCEVLKEKSFLENIFDSF